MSHLHPLRRRGLDWLLAMFHLKAYRKPSGSRSLSLPTAPRLRRDVGLPEMDPEPPVHLFLSPRL